MTVYHELPSIVVTVVETVVGLLVIVVGKRVVVIVMTTKTSIGPEQPPQDVGFTDELIFQSFPRKGMRNNVTSTIVPKETFTDVMIGKNDTLLTSRTCLLNLRNMDSKE